jgi:UDP-N-acetyl-D-mannosaminuronate dehydrogenase
LVVGLGEVGRPLLEVLSRAYCVEGVDIEPTTVSRPIDVMHVCYPAEIEDFAGTTREYAVRYQPDMVVIHSTVPMGTTHTVQQQVAVPVAYSPVRGKHARMADELLRYVKFVGAPDAATAARVEAYLQAAGLKTRRVSSTATAELAKLTETTYLGLLIAFAQDVDRMARSVGVAYDEVVAFYEEIGYLPPVRYFPGVIGGHCVMPNIALLKRRFHSDLLDAIEWSNEVRKEGPQ